MWTCLMGICLFFVIHIPLSREIRAVDHSLNKSWHELLNAEYGISLPVVEGNVANIRKNLMEIQKNANEITSRISLPEKVLDNLNQIQFSLINYEDQREDWIIQIQESALEHQVSLETDLEVAFPSHSVNLEDESMLWVQTSLLFHLLDTTIANGPKTIHQIETLPQISHLNKMTGFTQLEEFPTHIEMTGTMNSLFGFLCSLPLLEQEIQNRGFSKVHSEKPAMFIRKLILKASSESRNAVHLDLIVSGFFNRNEAL